MIAHISVRAVRFASIINDFVFYRQKVIVFTVDSYFPLVFVSHLAGNKLDDIYRFIGGKYGIEINIF